MKCKVLILAAGLALLASCGPSYNVTDQGTIVVPAGTQTAFTTQYPNATYVVWSGYDVALMPVDWELSDWADIDASDYLVRFNMGNDNYYGVYDADGNWIGTVYVVNDYNTLPDAISTTLRNQFPGYTISAVHREYQKDRMNYEIVLKNSMDAKVKLLLDPNGTIIRQKMK